MQFHIAHHDDIPTLARLNAQLIHDEGHQNPLSVPELQTRMRAWLATHYEAAIVEERGEPVAYALYREADDGWGDRPGLYLRQFFVVRELRRSGVGRRAFQLLRRELWGENRRITLETLLENHAARHFWKALGFSEYCVSYELPASAAKPEVGE